MPPPKHGESAEAAAGALRDKGAESETLAQETELGRHRPGMKKR
jgi:hypothetical protein